MVTASPTSPGAPGAPGDDTAALPREALRKQLARLHKLLLDTVRVDPICRRLMTAPGVGPLVALTYRACVAGDPDGRVCTDLVVNPGTSIRNLASYSEIYKKSRNWRGMRPAALADPP